MAVNDVWEIQLSWQIGSTPTLSVLHVKETESVTPDAGHVAAEAIVKAVHGATLLDAICDSMSDQVELISMYCRRVSPAADIPFLFLVGTNLPNAGTIDATPVPPQVAMLVSMYTNVMSRNGRGRVYIPGCPENAETEGVILTAQLALLQAVADEMLEDIIIGILGTGTVRVCVYSRELNQGNLVLVATPRSNLATIRGRRARPGVA